jgi:hypothetical protein
VDALAPMTQPRRRKILTPSPQRSSKEFCYRRVFAAWFEEQTGKVIEEVR